MRMSWQQQQGAAQPGGADFLQVRAACSLPGCIVQLSLMGGSHSLTQRRSRPGSAASNCRHRRRRSRRLSQAPTLDLQQAVQSALQDLMRAADLQHNDSWDASTRAPLADAQLQPARQTLSSDSLSQRPSARGGRSASHLAPPAPPASAAAAATDDEQWGPVKERDLPPAAALRLYQARLRAAQDELAAAQAAVKARDSKLCGLEKEVQQLRFAAGKGGFRE